MIVGKNLKPSLLTSVLPHPVLVNNRYDKKLYLIIILSINVQQATFFYYIFER
jgi:hypothetical protein